jgi:serine/threonine protein kinase/tetratricopeptide (TPR) repeat protein
MPREPSAPLAVGTRIGQYRIVAPVGSGGMGEVYEARDTRLDRAVALKILPEEVRVEQERIQRFVQEARAASALNHPHIVSIYDAGTAEVEEGTVYFIAMELVEGETLRSRMARRGTELHRVLDALTQVADALARAHTAGIVHRDLKPDNIMVTSDGYAKVLDFGLAKLRSSSSPQASESSEISTELKYTQPGAVMGTVGYMSPEQVRGETVDHRSDIFSFGCILYEVAAGRRPFVSDSTIDTLHKILHDDPAPASEFNPRVPGELERIIRKCLAKTPDRRYQSIKEAAIDLRALLESQPRASDQRRPEPARTAAAKHGGSQSIAVLPFADLASDPENVHIGLGLADATITELARVKSLLVRPTAAILKFQKESSDPVVAGRELGVDAVVSGSFQRSGQRLRVTVQLVSIAENRPLWATKINTSLEDVFEMQDEVSRQIATALELELTAGDEARMARVPRASAEAYDLYLKGKLHVFTERLEELNIAIDFFEQACRADPKFALAWAGLAEGYLRLAFSFDPEANWYERAKEICDQALELDPQLPEGRYLRGRLLWSPQGKFDHAGALCEFVGAIAARPSLNQAHHWLAVVLMHISLFDEASDAFQQAMAIYPRDEMAFSHLGFLRLLQGRFEEGVELSQQTVGTYPSAWSYYEAALSLVRLGRLDEAATTVETASRLFIGEPLLFSIGAVIAAARSRPAEGRRLIERTVQHEKAFGHYHHAQYDLACAHALMGDHDEAMGWLEAAARNGFPAYGFFEIDPLFESIRELPRFGSLMADLRKECDRYRVLYQELQARRLRESGQ